MFTLLCFALITFDPNPIWTQVSWGVNLVSDLERVKGERGGGIKSIFYLFIRLSPEFRPINNSSWLQIDISVQILSNFIIIVIDIKIKNTYLLLRPHNARLGINSISRHQYIYHQYQYQYQYQSQSQSQSQNRHDMSIDYSWLYRTLYTMI